MGRNSVKKVRLYTTLGCHLCEQAAAMLGQFGADVEVEAVEISADDDLVSRYGVRIPVIGHAEVGEELGWPFDMQQLAGYLDQLPPQAD